MLAVAAPFAVPAFDELIVSLLALLAGFVALGLIAGLHGFVRATVGGIAGLLAKIPGIGGVLSSPVNQVVHWMDHELGAAELAVDHLISRWMAVLGQLVSWWGREIRDLAHALYAVTNALSASTALEALYRLTHLIAARVVTVEHAAADALARIRALADTTEAAILHVLSPRIHALEHAVDDVIYPDIAGLRARTRDLLDRLDNTWHTVRKLDALTATAAITAAVAIALPRLGLGWIRCGNWRRIGESVCRLPVGLIDALLLGVFEALVVTDLCDFAALMTGAAEEVRPALFGFVDVEQALVGCHGADAPPDLALPQLQLPPVRQPLSLGA